MSMKVLAIQYVHEHNGKNYDHDFGPGVQMWAQPDGSILICKPGKRIFDEFPDED